MCLLYKYEGWSKWFPSTSKIPHSSSLYALPSRGFLNFLMEEPLFAAQMLPVTTRRESIGKSLRKKKKMGKGHHSQLTALPSRISENWVEIEKYNKLVHVTTQEADSQIQRTTVATC